MVVSLAEPEPRLTWRILFFVERTPRRGKLGSTEKSPR